MVVVTCNKEQIKRCILNCGSCYNSRHRLEQQKHLFLLNSQSISQWTQSTSELFSWLNLKDRSADDVSGLDARLLTQQSRGNIHRAYLYVVIK